MPPISPKAASTSAPSGTPRACASSVEDDGPGFAPDILEQIGEPYVTSRPGSYALGETELGPAETFTGQQGMGLGFFIAKTLIEQTGGRVQVRNRPKGGARVSRALAARGAGRRFPAGHGQHAVVIAV